MTAVYDLLQALGLWIGAAWVWTVTIEAVAAQARGSREDDDRFWSGVLLAALVPCLAAPLVRAFGLADSGVMVDAAILLAAAAPTSEAPSADRPWPGVMDAVLAGAAGCYLLVAAGKLAACARAFAWLGALARSARASPGGEPQVRWTDEPVGPFAFGIFDRVVVLPRAAVAVLSAKQMRMVVAHERRHLQRYDPLLFLMLEVVDAVFWISPGVLRLTARLRLAAELQCDDAAVRGGDARAYARAIMALSGAFRAAPSGAPGAARQVRSRLQRILARPAASSTMRSSAIFAWVAATTVGAVLAVSATRVVELASTPFRPAVQGRITQAFGASGPSGPHEGVDVAAPSGTVVLAPAHGRVLFAGWASDREGNVVIIEHTNGWRTYYSHLLRPLVAAGRPVSRGRPIGRVGSSGRSSGPHLHVEVRRGPRRADPLPAGLA